MNNPIKLPLGEIAAAAKTRIQQVLADYQKKRRERPAGWSTNFTEALSQISNALQGVSDEQIEREIANYRRQRRAGKK